MPTYKPIVGYQFSFKFCYSFLAGSSCSSFFLLGIRWDLMIFIVPASYSLFCTLLKMPIDIKIDTHVFRTLSHDIYFIHGILLMLYTYFDLHFHSMLYFVTILFVSIGISFLKSVIINSFKNEPVNKNV